MFVGAIIKETIKDESFLDLIEIEKVEIWKTNDPQIKYWTMIFFKSNALNIPEQLSKVIINDWFADMKKDEKNTSYLEIMFINIPSVIQKKKIMF